jgi:histidinol-phosphate/aromatic aminotransferase/cobyric acid decarboxylase-like protein
VLALDENGLQTREERLDRLTRALFEEAPSFAILVHPNNPTGSYFTRDQLCELADSFPSTRFIIDETYVEYIGRAHSVESEVARRDNVFVLKSMSKVYALSGARVAYLAGPPKTVAALRAHLPPWAVSLPAQIAAAEALRDPGYYEQRYAETRQLADACVTDCRSACDLEIRKTGLPCYLVDAQSRSEAVRIINELKSADIFVRDCASFGSEMQSVVRITVRSAVENARILSALAGVVSTGAVKSPA